MSSKINGKAYSVLAVTPDKLDGVILGFNLKNSVYSLDFTTDSQEALEKGTIDNYDLILTDISLSGMTGFDLLNDLRFNGVQTPVIAYTAYLGTDLVSREKKYSFDAVLIKPIPKVQLINTLNDLIFGFDYSQFSKKN